MKEYEIWSEGYEATGEHGGAHFHGKSFGEILLTLVKTLGSQKTLCALGA